MLTDKNTVKADPGGDAASKFHTEWRRKYEEQQKRAEEARKAAKAAAKIEAALDVEDADVADDVEFTQYAPAKLRVGAPHPDPVVENASLASVAPPDVGADCLDGLDAAVIDEARLSALQLESVAYASRRFRKRLASGARCGFFIGDGAGMGKGRQIAGIVAQRWAAGCRKHLWVSVSNDLRFDAERDLRDLGAAAADRVVALNKLDYAPLKHEEAVVFCTYAALVAGKRASAKAKARRRLDQLLDWCGADFEGCLLFDESHKAKNLFGGASGAKPTKVGQAVLELQTALPHARVRPPAIFAAAAAGEAFPRRSSTARRRARPSRSTSGTWTGSGCGARARTRRSRTSPSSCGRSTRAASA